MDTRERLLAAALRLFADKGFYGASIEQIGREVGLTKQALLHHFGSKQKLYGAVLERISARLLADLDDCANGVAPEQAFEQALLRIHARTQQHPQDTQLLMRELLDNRSRAAEAGVWYLRPFLDALHRQRRRTTGWAEGDAGADARTVATHVYQLLGAINYFAVSQTTLQAMYGAEHIAALREAFPAHLRQLARLPPTEATPPAADEPATMGGATPRRPPR